MLKANLLTVGVCQHCEIGSLPTHVAGKQEEHKGQESKFV